MKRKYKEICIEIGIGEVSTESRNGLASADRYLIFKIESVIWSRKIVDSRFLFRSFFFSFIDKVEISEVWEMSQSKYQEKRS